LKPGGGSGLFTKTKHRFEFATGHRVVDWPIARDCSPVYVVAGDMTSECVAKTRKLNQDDFRVGIAADPRQPKTVSGMADANSIKPASSGSNRQGARHFPGSPASRAAAFPMPFARPYTLILAHSATAVMPDPDSPLPGTGPGSHDPRAPCRLRIDQRAGEARALQLEYQ
jgi:hypothetical protein